MLIQGPKWCGKTTTAQRFASSSLSLPDPSGGFAARQLAELDPAQAIVGRAPRLIDEWQEVPKTWDAVRFECDRRVGDVGQFLLTGSATPRDANQPMDTMALLELGISSGAISLGEMLSGKPSGVAIGSIGGLSGIAELLCRGGWPQAVGRTTEEAMRIATAHIDGVCESNISRTGGVGRDPVKVRALLPSLARNESTFAGTKSIGRDIGGEVSKNSISRYMDAPHRINIVDDVPAWYPALRSPVKLRQGPKRHLADPSLVVALIGASPESLSADPKTLGLLFESLVLHDLKVYAAVNDACVSRHHDGDGLEVDAIVHRRDGSWVAIEVKLGASQIPEASRNLDRLEKKMIEHGERPPAAKCIIVGYGIPARTTSDGTIVVPIDTLGI